MRMACIARDREQPECDRPRGTSISRGVRVLHLEKSPRLSEAVRGYAKPREVWSPSRRFRITDRD